MLDALIWNAELVVQILHPQQLELQSAEAEGRVYHKGWWLLLQGPLEEVPTLQQPLSFTQPRLP